MVEKLSPRRNIQNLQRFGKFHVLVLVFFLILRVVYSQPLEFPCVIKPRSPYAVDLIRSFSGPDGLDLVQ